MNNFSYYNPTKIIFGKGSIAAIATEIPTDAKVLVTYGGGSIKSNGVYDQVKEALKQHQWVEFGGIEPNPSYETLMKGVELVRRESVTMLLAVGGGSVIDGTKFIAAAAKFSGDPWEILSKQAPVESAVPLGVILTLPATGSEANGNAVVSRKSTREKLLFGTPHCFPQFAVLDPETTYSLPPRQLVNGVVDAFVHVMEQYMTYPAAAPLQDRVAESILATLLEIGDKVLSTPGDYDTMANLMWCANLGLNGLIGCGVPQDWSSHMIGHELTAEYGLSHAQTLAIVLPGLLRNRKGEKREKLLQYAARIWGLNTGSEDERIDSAISRTEAFFESLGAATRFNICGVDGAAAAEKIADRFAARGEIGLGERGSITPEIVREILKSRA